MMNIQFFNFVISLLITVSCIAQNPDPTRFKNEIEQFKLIKADQSSDRIVFTGSSSIRLWKDLNAYYPNRQLINTGFGGSHMSDLLYYLKETVLRYSPSKVFIYEGDNDIANGISEEKIMYNTKKVIELIHSNYPECKIILIAPKPSIARWEYKEQYLSVNSKFQELADQNEKISFANVWDVMLDSNGELKENLFIEDNLHMNKNGYDLWDKLIAPYLN